MICLKDLFHAYKNNDTKLVQEFISPGTVFFLQLDKKDVYSWNAKKIFDITDSFNQSRKELILVHMSDNQKGIHNATMYSAFYNEFKIVFRNYWWRSDVMLNQLQQEGLLYYFPLGYSSNIIKHKSNSALPMGLRNSTISFVGNNKSGNPRRSGNLNEINSKLTFNVSGMVHQHMFGMGSVSQYISLMKYSKFCLNIRGNFVECYRMYDAFEMGCIVIMIDMYDTWDYTAEHIEQLAPLLEFKWYNSKGTYITPNNTASNSDSNSDSNINSDTSTNINTNQNSWNSLSKYDNTHLNDKTIDLLSTGSGGGCPIKKHKMFSSTDCESVTAANVPFLWFKTIQQAIDFLQTIHIDTNTNTNTTSTHSNTNINTNINSNANIKRSNDMYIQELYNDQTLWWYQMKRHYQQLFEEKLCVI